MTEQKRSALRILEHIVPNSKCKNWNVNIPICNTRIFSLDLPDDEESEYRKKELEKVGPVGIELIGKIKDLPGLDSLSLQRYSLQVVIADAFEWDGIEEYIVAALRECFGDRATEVEFSSEDIRHRYREGPSDFD